MKQRIVTGVVAGAAFIFLLTLGGFYFAALIVLLTAVGMFEFNRMNGMSSAKLTAVLGYAFALYIAFPWGEVPGWSAMSYETTVWLALFLLFAATVLSKNKVTLDHISLHMLGIVYIGTGFHYMISTRLGDNGLFWTLMLFVCIWLSDSGAYFTGRAIGKTPLWPTISPKKTVEGALGGVAAAVAAALCFSLYAPDLLGWGRAVGLGIVIAVVGQMGDLIQSAYKRIRGIKDSGSILPGHGGVLDRCDSWLIVFPFVQLLSLIPQ
ncbi:phosphatidate cytidylyltransferase [Paenibacillus flagellatus]|uniref:Phosphatidate cytidylyltransferase n=1 Tax=Paenibacillus flagellatus TaxID=2211139 RepID=A0A2V5JW56_9BACL|nr:phosphatidate cytidylyltransferase [Paenibacillus flagellatus]PYI50402.1 phosphatidate cytidylyltransferase [Paenibacillus flagellatus]